MSPHNMIPSPCFKGRKEPKRNQKKKEKKKKRESQRKGEEVQERERGTKKKKKKRDPKGRKKRERKKKEKGGSENKETTKGSIDLFLPSYLPSPSYMVPSDFLMGIHFITCSKPILFPFPVQHIFLQLFLLFLGGVCHF